MFGGSTSHYEGQFKLTCSSGCQGMVWHLSSAQGSCCCVAWPFVPCMRSTLACSGAGNLTVQALYGADAQDDCPEQGCYARALDLGRFNTQRAQSLWTAQSCLR